MKGKRPFEADFPPTLLDPLNIYLDVYRPYLLTLGSEGSPDATGRLWISNEGRPMDDQSIRNAIKKRTRKAFGRDLTPHLFRDCSVTSLIRDAPSSARLAKSILSHQTLEMTNKHSNQSKMVETSRRHAALIGQLANATCQE
jgi:integrase/recombinase XerC